MALRRAVVAVLAIVAASVTGLAASAQAASDPFTHAATGVVFFPNPVQQTGNENLTDSKDADSPAFAAAYHQVTLRNLDGSGTLTGAYVRVKSKTGKPATSTNGAFPAFHRGDDQFEQIMGYYWVDTAQAYLQHLGFGSTLRPVNQRQIELRIDQFGGDNSFFRDDKANITLGKGGRRAPVLLRAAAPAGAPERCAHTVLGCRARAHRAVACALMLRCGSFRWPGPAGPGSRRCPGSCVPSATVR